MAEPLPTPLRRWCMAAAGACLLPLLLQVPAGIGIALAAMAGLGYVFDRRWPGPMRLLLVALVMGYLVLTFGFNLGRDTGTALLATLLAVKPGETRSLRDARSLLGFSLFAPFAAFLQDQGPLVLALAMLALGLLLVALAMLAEHRPGEPAPRLDRGRSWATLRAVAVALPLALAAFWLFPRLATPLWGMPANVLGQGGIDEKMTPDQWIDLFGSDQPALRVRFLDPPPPPRQMYWRAQVLWNFNGASWTREPRLQRLAAAEVVPRDAVLRYEVTLEPTEQNYLAVMDLPLAAPEGSRMLADATIITSSPVSRMRKYEAVSAPGGHLVAELEPGLRDLATRLPPDLNPRTVALGRQWLAESGGDDTRVVQRALAWIEQEFSYSLTVPPTGRHAADEFLFDSQVGFCQQYSSAFPRMPQLKRTPVCARSRHVRRRFNAPESP